MVYEGANRYCAMVKNRCLVEQMCASLVGMSSDDVRYVGILFEEVRDQMKVVLEAVGDLPTRREFEELRQYVVELKQDVKVIKAAVTDQSHQLADHEHRVIRLEAA